jgi:hypothetical protein
VYHPGTQIMKSEANVFNWLADYRPRKHKAKSGPKTQVNMSKTEQAIAALESPAERLARLASRKKPTAFNCDLATIADGDKQAVIKGTWR